MTVPTKGLGLWPDTNASIPAGWSRDTAFDGRFIKGDTDAFAGSGNGGSADHTHVASPHKHGLGPHEHNFSAGATSDASSGTRGSDAANRPSPTHSHSSVVSEFDTPLNTETDNTTVTFPVQSHDWVAVKLIVIKPDDGNQEYPDDAFCYTDKTTLPLGYTKITEPLWEGATIKAPTTGNDGGARAGDTPSHNHSAQHVHGWTEVHKHASKRCGGNPSPINVATGGIQLTRTPTHHMVTGDDATGGEIFSNYGYTSSKTATLPYNTVLGIINTSGGAKSSVGIIIPYSDTVNSIPTGWVYCNGSNNTPDLRNIFPRMSLADGNIGNTGGSDTHTHPGTQTHTHASAPHTHAALVTRDQETSCHLFGTPVTAFTYPSGNDTHTHVWTFTDVTPTVVWVGITSASANHVPLYRTVIFIKKVAELKDPILTKGVIPYAR